MTTWEEELKKAFKENGDDFKKIKTTLSDKEMKTMFDNGYGGEQGVPFTAWGEKYVYFPLCYDGAEWVGSAPRNVCDIKSKHQGG